MSPDCVLSNARSVAQMAEVFNIAVLDADVSQLDHVGGKTSST